MSHMQFIEPVVGDWYRSHGQIFEVVAIDDAERVIEIQHADGDLEEIEFEDWATRCRAGSLSEEALRSSGASSAVTREPARQRVVQSSNSISSRLPSACWISMTPSASSMATTSNI